MMNCLLWKTVTVLSLVWAVGGQITVNPEHGDVRLVGLNGHTRGMGGHVEVYINGVWHTISVITGTRQTADVICRQLGFPVSVYNDSTFSLGYSNSDSSSTHVIDNISCSGSENRVLDCDYTVGRSRLFFNMAVLCGGTQYSEAGAQFGPIEGEIRLNTGGDSRPFSGRLEIYINNQWGTVCDDGFRQTEAETACRQLGLLGNIYSGNVGRFRFEQGSGPIWIDNIRCSSEPSQTIAECASGPFGVHDCDHSEDVALVCRGEGSLRLRSRGRLGGLGSTGPGVSTGLLEVYARRQWGTVCDDLFTQTSADLACRQLGYFSANSFGDVDFPLSSLPIQLDDVQCTTDDDFLLLCNHSVIRTHDCGHHEDIQLSCSTIDVASNSPGGGIVAGVVAVTIVFVITLILIFGCCCCCCCCYCYKKKKTASKPAPPNQVVRSQANAYPMQTVQPQAGHPQQDPVNPPANFAPYPTNQAAPTQNSYGSQPVPPYPTGQYADPAYPPAPYATGQQSPAKDPTGQQPPSPYATGQQPLAKDSTGQQPLAPYATGQQSPAKDPTGQQPPAPYPSSGIVVTQPHVKDAPPPYAEIFTTSLPQ